MKANASPTKDFFVRTITKDISLDSCILDLIDNSLDGAHRIQGGAGASSAIVDRYDGLHAKVQVAADSFSINDNCGGISISNAIDYAFNFGRRPDAPSDGDYSIGLYGIGMKRAILKIGRTTDIYSSTESEAFRCVIDVDKWIKESTWEFDLTDADRGKSSGTAIKIKDLYEGVSAEFGDITFINRLRRIIARDYTRFLEKGFRIEVNDVSVVGHSYAVRASEDFKPYRKLYEDDGVQVEIIAGMAAPPPDALEATDRVGDTEFYGWFVLCNDRVVLAADKSNRTIWGNTFPAWHPQYNGFIGMVLFHAKDAGLLPWTTTKRDVDESSPLYRRAQAEMKSATQAWLSYTNQRRADLEGARIREMAATPVALFDVGQSQEFVVPTFSQAPTRRIANISYQKPLSEVRTVAEKLGNPNMSYKEVGLQTFEYFVSNEVGE